MTFTFSLTPGDILNSNDRSLHWGAKARRAKALRQRAAIAWRLAGSPHVPEDKPDPRLHVLERRLPDWPVDDLADLLAELDTAVTL